jgi:NADH-quinone oxidoreductase subunit N
MIEIFILSGLGILTLLAEIFNFKKLLVPIVIIGLVATLGIAVCEFLGYTNVNSNFDANVTTMLQFDRFANGYIILLTFIALLWVIINYSFFTDENNEVDHLALILFSIVGGYCMVSYTNFVMLFLGIEILAIPMYVLAGSNKKSLRSNEAALKYFLMGSFATGILLFGITLIYGSVGSFYVYDVRIKTTAMDFAITPMFTVGIVMLVGAMSFKSSLAPFHFWAPDVYTGAPTPVTSFMSTFVKTSAVGAFMRLFYTALPIVPEAYKNLFFVLILASLFVGNIIAVFQVNTKRLLAYSSISHVGFMLIAVLCFTEHTSVNALFFYLAAYSITTLAAFMVLKIVGEQSGGNEDITVFNGLVKRNPILAGTLTIAMLSMAGIPPLSGFFAKYYILYIALNHGYFWLVIVAILASLVGVYYYFKIIIAMFAGTPASASPVVITLFQKIILIALTLLIISLGLNGFVFNMI